jgi:murein DD-endopeptidase MepM/ murein hydrolase activator NlpD
MNQPVCILEFKQSLHGTLKRVHITQRFVKVLLISSTVLALLALGMFATYLHMSWKVSNYDKLRADFDSLRHRYQELQKVSKQSREQMASLENLASEVSVEFGLKQPKAATGPSLDSDTMDADGMTRGVKESIAEFNFLKSASYTGLYHRYAYQWQQHMQPATWPVMGAIRSPFGLREDPFSGEGAFHTGLDLSASTGTPVRVTADGVVAHTGWNGRYGKLVIVDHGNGVQTYYAHLSEYLVVPGQDVRQGQTVALSGGTGRVTSPHLHYEVRLGGNPVNPYRYLPKTQIAKGAEVHHSDFGF